ncbi:hypothetical protein WMF31_02140 [Sorangium sp. So ce1036]|uniref:hypothetical protein n=1 Tax=Sorangium sp. So ce1036 TaxID=3133328 RepID=UPI003F02D7DC
MGGSPPGLNALSQKLIPSIALQDPTGEWDELPSLVDYWTKPDVVAVIKERRQSLLVDIGNEVANPAWEAGCKDAIPRMRANGDCQDDGPFDIRQRGAPRPGAARAPGAAARRAAPASPTVTGTTETRCGEPRSATPGIMR